MRKNESKWRKWKAKMRNLSRFPWVFCGMCLFPGENQYPILGGHRFPEEKWQFLLDVKQNNENQQKQKLRSADPTIIINHSTTTKTTHNTHHTPHTTHHTTHKTHHTPHNTHHTTQTNTTRNTNQHDTTQTDTTQHNTNQHKPTQHSTAQHSTAQHCTAQHNRAQHNTTQHNTTQHNRAQHNTNKQTNKQTNKWSQYSAGDVKGSSQQFVFADCHKFISIRFKMQIPVPRFPCWRLSQDSKIFTTWTSTRPILRFAVLSNGYGLKH